MKPTRQFFITLLAVSPLFLAVVLYGYTIRLTLFLDDAPQFFILDQLGDVEYWGGSLAYHYYRPFLFSFWKAAHAIAGDYDPVQLHWINIMNRVTDAKGRSAIPIDAIENNLRRKTNARIPLNDTVFLAAVNQGVSVIATDTTKSPARDLLQLAESVRRSVEGVEEPDLSEAQQPERKSSRLSGIFGRG